MVHAYTPKAIQTALKAGVQSIEHGQLMDEATAKMIAEKGAWLSLQPFLDDEDAIPFPEGSDQRKKQLTMTTPRIVLRENTRSRRRSAPTCFSIRSSRRSKASSWRNLSAGTRRSKY